MEPELEGASMSGGVGVEVEGVPGASKTTNINVWKKYHDPTIIESYSFTLVTEITDQ